MRTEPSWQPVTSVTKKKKARKLCQGRGRQYSAKISVRNRKRPRLTERQVGVRGEPADAVDAVALDLVFAREKKEQGHESY